MRYQRTGHYPPIDDIVKTDVTKEIACKLMRVGAGIVFLSELEKDEYKALRDGKPDTHAVFPVQEAIYSDLGRAIAGVIKQKLHYRMQLVLRLRFRLDHRRDHTLAEVAEILKVTRERVRQIQKRALQRLDGPEMRYLAELPLEVNEPVEPEEPPKKRKYAKRKTKKRKKKR